MKLIRWQYFAPRLLVVAVIFSAFRWGLDPALHWLIVFSGESAVGAKVELATVHTSLRRGELVLDDLAIANPSAPMRNLLEFDRATLDVDMRSLAKARIRVRDGRMEQVRFDSRRSTSGALEAAPVDDGPSAFDPIWESASEYTTEWLDDVSDRLTTDFTDELQTPRVAQEIEQRWTQKSADLQQRARELRQQSKAVEADFQEIRKNPLRGVERLPELQAQLKTVQEELKSLDREIKEIPQQTTADRKALDAARKADELYLREQLNVEQIDGERLAQMLLGKPVSDNLYTALDWISWARGKVPHNPVRANAKKRSRGTLVHFSPPEPRLLVERLQLEVIGSMGGEELQLVGELTGFSSEPQRLADPLRLELQSVGPMPLTVELVADRRTETAIDRLHLVCPRFAFAERNVGGSKLAISVPASRAEIEVELLLTDDVLDGRIVYHQPSVRLIPDATGKGGKALQDLFEKALAHIDEVSAEVSLAGTVKRPTIHIESELGSQLTSGIQEAVAQLAQERSEALMANVTRQVDAQMDKLNTAKARFEEEMLSSLGEHQQLFEQIASFGNPASPGLPIPQLSDSLRKGLQRK